MAIDYSGETNYQEYKPKKWVQEIDEIQEPKKLPRDDSIPDFYGGDRKIVGSGWYKFLILIFILFLIGILALGIWFAYYYINGAEMGYFKPVVQQEISPVIQTNITNNAPVTSNVNNQYSNNFPLNATIIIQNLNIYKNNS